MSGNFDCFTENDDCFSGNDDCFSGNDDCFSGNDDFVRPPDLCGTACSPGSFSEEIKNDDLCIKKDVLCIKKDVFLHENDVFCIKKDVFVFKMMDFVSKQTYRDCCLEPYSRLGNRIERISRSPSARGFQGGRRGGGG